MSRTVIRGSRGGGRGVTESGDGPRAACQPAVFACSLGHRTTLSFATDVELPAVWDCSCGRPSGPEELAAPQQGPLRTGKTHLQHVQERRDPAAAEALLQVALDALHR